MKSEAASRCTIFRIVASSVIVLAAIQALGQSPVPIRPMAADAHASFTVATIKPHDPASQHMGFAIHGDGMTIRNESVAKLLQMAYAVHPRQIVGAQDWLFRDTYDIEGKTDTQGEPTTTGMREIIQQLLADRFGLQFHREQRELSVYAIVVAKGGAKLSPAADPTAETDQDANTHGTETTVSVTSATMADFILGMQFFLDRPLVDRTHLAGRYDFKVRYTFDEASTPGADAPPGIFTAIQEQLGLKLEAVKAPVDVFVIDRVDRPSAN
jgi:uncharacterized protein (TIGR03435 family)